MLDASADSPFWKIRAAARVRKEAVKLLVRDIEGDISIVDEVCQECIDQHIQFLVFAVCQKQYSLHFL
jgi:hypothetical protein